MSKLYYSISEVATMLSVNQSLLRFWEKEFEELITPHKNPKGTRAYTEENIETLKLIYHLVRVQGFTLPGAKKRIKENKTSLVKDLEIHNSLVYIREELQAIRKGLTLPTDEPELD
jgi:DNA-binding transcriptional MerR regulator